MATILEFTALTGQELTQALGHLKVGKNAKINWSKPLLTTRFSRRSRL